MNDDPLSDLEERLRAWRPAEVPAELRARLRSARPAPRRKVHSPRLALAAACGLAVGFALWLLTGHFTTPREEKTSSAAEFSRPSRADGLEAAAESRWVPGESLTMNIYTGVPPGNVPAALRLDEDSVVSSGLILVRCADDKLPLKVDCQF